jgi:hypothetical protein
MEDKVITVPGLQLRSRVFHILKQTVVLTKVISAAPLNLQTSSVTLGSRSMLCPILILIIPTQHKRN